MGLHAITVWGKVPHPSQFCRGTCWDGKIPPETWSWPFLKNFWSFCWCLKSAIIFDRPVLTAKLLDLQTASTFGKRAYRIKHRNPKDTQGHRKEDIFLGYLMNKPNMYLKFDAPTSLYSMSMRLFIPGFQEGIGAQTFSVLGSEDCYYFPLWHLGSDSFSGTLNNYDSVVSYLSPSAHYLLYYEHIFLAFFYINRNFKNWGLQVSSI